jgi:hypothetical protein
MDSTITWNRLVSHLSKLIFKQLDLLFTVKELSTSMAKPALTAVQRLRKLVGYLKSTPEYCVLVDVPIGGQGRWRSSDKHWILESLVTATGVPNRFTVGLQAVVYIC